jgi:hypothetical protein
MFVADPPSGGDTISGSGDGMIAGKSGTERIVNIEQREYA